MFINDKELVNTLMFGLCNMLLSAADFALLIMSKVFISSIEEERTDFHVDGYTVTGIGFSAFTIALWVAPYLNYALGSKTIMTIAAVGILVHIVCCALEEAWTIYVGAVIGGICAAAYYPTQAHYIIHNSSDKYAARNIGIVFLLFMISLVVGNISIYVAFKGLKYINQTARRTAMYTLIGINIAAVFAFMALPLSKKSENERYGLIRTIRRSLKILKTPKMLWMILTFLYQGLQQCFWSGVYSSSIGFTLAFGEYSKELVGLSGVFMGFGGVAGTLIPIVLAGRIRGHSYARRLIVMAGCVAQICTYLIAFINLPDTAVFGNTEELSIIKPSIALVLTGSVLLLFGDSIFMTQVYCFISDNYRESSAEASALFKFIKAISTTMSFYWCSHLGLHTQTLILEVAAVVGGAGFCMADRNSTESLQVIEKNTNDVKPTKDIKAALPT